MTVQPSLQDRKREVVLRPQDPAARHGLAEALFGEGDLAGAIAQLEKAISLDQDHVPSRRLLARAYARDQRRDQAHQLLLETVRLFPDDVDVRDELIELYLEQNRIDDALIHTAEAARLRPEEATRWATHGRLLARHMLLEPAEEALRRASRLAPDNREFSRDLELVSRERAQLRGDLGRTELPSAAEIFAGAGLSGSSGTLSKAAQLVISQDTQSAKRLLVTASPAERISPLYWLIKAEISFAGEDNARAEGALQQAIAASPHFAMAWRRMGDVALLEGRMEDAKNRYQEALRLKPDDLALKAHVQHVARWAPATGRSGRIEVLAWNVVGGNVSPLQAVVLPGKGDVFVTGNVGDSIQESARLALSVIRARVSDFGLPDVHDRDVHFHLVDTELRKDGRSAGLALTLAALSALLNREFPDRLACTGEITLAGEVRPISGVREKVIAAYLTGCRTVMLPRRNLPEASALPVEVTGRLPLVYVDTIHEAFQLLLTGA